MLPTNNKYWFFIITLVFLSFGCKKETTETFSEGEFIDPRNLEEVLQTIYNAYLEDRDGVVLLTNNKMFGDNQSSWRISTHVQANLFDRNKRPISGGRLQMNTFEIEPDSFGRYSSREVELSNLFGSPISMSFENFQDTTLFNAPKGLFVTSPAMGASDYKNISSLDSITWNRDTENSLGIFFFVEFRPSAPGNEEFQSYSRKFYYSHYDGDSGLLQLTPSMFADIPDGGIIKIGIGRLNYKFWELPENQGPQKILLAAGTYAIGLFRFDEP